MRRKYVPAVIVATLCLVLITAPAQAQEAAPPPASGVSLAYEPLMQPSAIHATAVQTATFDTTPLTDAVNAGIEYGFTIAGNFAPLIALGIGLSVAFGLIGALIAFGPKLGRIIRNAFS